MCVDQASLHLKRRKEVILGTEGGSRRSTVNMGIGGRRLQVITKRLRDRMIKTHFSAIEKVPVDIPGGKGAYGDCAA